MKPTIWMRAESRPTERRAPLSPRDAGSLVAAGMKVTVEHSPTRVFPDEAYAGFGCQLAAPGSWVDAPDHALILGLKELPDTPDSLRHRHAFFGHAFKGQASAAALLARFHRGGGALCDLEYMIDADGRRVAAFGYWAGFMGAALGVLQLAGQLGLLAPFDHATLVNQLRDAGAGLTGLRCVVIGAKGRCGRGATEALAHAGLVPSLWDQEETRQLDRHALLSHELLVNCVGITGAAEPFLRPDDLPGSLRLIVDVTCDLGSPANALPIYDRLTSWSDPVAPICDGLGIIAIDNLPSLLPQEASTDFSAALTPHLLKPGQGPVWDGALARFRAVMQSFVRKEIEHA